MQFDKNNKVIKLCAEGMELEGQGKLTEAAIVFNRAWNIATNDFEKFTSAHYVARHQKNTADKLAWDKTALQHALNINDETVKETLPSLYLNIGKCYEDLNDFNNAKIHYRLAFSVTDHLLNNGYGNMIKAGIDNALKRMT